MHAVKYDMNILIQCFDGLICYINLLSFLEVDCCLVQQYGDLVQK